MSSISVLGCKPGVGAARLRAARQESLEVAVDDAAGWARSR